MDTATFCSILRSGLSYTSKTKTVSSNKENALAFSYIMNLFVSLGTFSISCLSSPFLWASNPIRFLLVNFLCCTKKSTMKLSSCRSSYSFLQRVTKLLKTSLDSSKYTFTSLKLCNLKVQMERTYCS